ncbi:Clavaminate synthase-like protein [Corynespora cassiicola Philippines]|uniref:Clavaminate synthase-like protein n=1 Tax=Corynespora cassiicola Philippines TaxID=1448308 RepID=A0A2T2P780_CORCC|nr:Clavaminate synthase-like protein [Corynespora cassiicola Philippines]
MTGAPRREEVIELWFSALKEYLSTTHHQTQLSDQSSKRRKLSPSIQDTYISCSFSETPIPNPILRHPIPRVENPSFSAFQSKLSLPETQTPILIEGAISHWPALSDPNRQWKNPSYLLSHTLDGRRLVPIELGRAYTDSNWTQKIMSFGEFMRDHMFDSPPKHSISPNSKAPHCKPRKKPTAYLAQHDLLTQLPTLRPDICIPDYCYTAPAPPSAPLPGHAPRDSRLPDPLLNAWLGPRGTTSPLHTDPYHNILAQVVGCKYIRLYAPEHSRALWPRGTERGVNMGNTSSIDLGTAMALFPEIGAGLEDSGAIPHHKHQPDEPDPEARAGNRPAVDAQLHGHAREFTKPENSEADCARDPRRRRSFHSRFPGFVDAPYRECVLGPGECLYIPAGWWHYVRSLSPSFSVSFWWD